MPNEYKLLHTGQLLESMRGETSLEHAVTRASNSHPYCHSVCGLLMLNSKTAASVCSYHVSAGLRQGINIIAMAAKNALSLHMYIDAKSSYYCNFVMAESFNPFAPTDAFELAKMLISFCST